MITWEKLVAEAEATIATAGVPDAAGSARWIAREATGTDAEEWLDVATTAATERQLASFDRMVARRCEGEPLQYVLGSWGFRRLDLYVDRRVLIPRPETEIIAGAAIDEFDRVGGPAGGAPVVDLGTGSGAIGLSVAIERPGSSVWLTDASTDALAVARANLAGVGRAGGGVSLAAGDWFAALPPELAGTIGVVVSNPPYVAAESDLEPQVSAWEPLSALLAGEEGRRDLLVIIAQAPLWLRPGGSLVLEMAPDQVAPVSAEAGIHFAEVEPIIDLADRPRGIVCRLT
ncbi:MAG: peptide chain release factor N(5)-glutamine methyltransferase [Actinomycetota bacterium]